MEVALKGAVILHDVGPSTVAVDLQGPAEALESRPILAHTAI